MVNPADTKKDDDIEAQKKQNLQDEFIAYRDAHPFEVAYVTTLQLWGLVLLAIFILLAVVHFGVWALSGDLSKIPSQRMEATLLLSGLASLAITLPFPLTGYWVRLAYHELACWISIVLAITTAFGISYTLYNYLL